MSAEILDDIRAIAAELGIPPQSLSRDAYQDAPGKQFAARQVRAAFGPWKNATRAAAGIEVEAAPMVPVPMGHAVHGVSTLVDSAGNTVAQWIKTRKEAEDREAILARLVEELPTKIPVREGSIAAPTHPLADDLLDIYPIGDAHLGMYASEAETGRAWDLAKAVTIHQRAIDALTIGTPHPDDPDRPPRDRAEARKGLLINLGDFFHTDPGGKTTVKGTSVDTSARMVEVYEAGLALKIYMIDRLLEAHAEVEVWNELGNHDGITGIFLGISLRQHYRNEPRVTVQVTASGADYLEHGKCLVASTHGDAYKEGELESIMSHDQKLAWGRTDHRFWLIGHIHHKQRRRAQDAKDYRGCEVETFRTLAPRDAWHNRAGYRAYRDMNRITLHKEWGRVATLTRSAGYLMAA